MSVSGIGILLALLLGFCQHASGPFPSLDVQEDEWGISDWSSVRLGQLSIIHDPSGDRLFPYVLSTSERREMPYSPHSATPACDGNCFLVSSFEYGSRNQLGGYSSTFFMAPSVARLSLAEWEDGRPALTLDFNRAGAGFCGMWIHLFDFRQSMANRIYLNAGSYSFLTFWIRGQRGNERMLLKVSDADLEKKEDALKVGDLGAFLPKGKIETGWQRALVPMEALPRNLSRRHLAALIFEVVGPGEGRIAIKDLAFCIRSEPLPSFSTPANSRRTNQEAGKALWVWDTAKILPIAAEQAALVDFCRRLGIVHVYLQLPKDEMMGPGGQPLPLEKHWRPFLALLARSGVHAYALDGFREYALPAWHERVLETVDSIVAYNRTAGPGERFAGVHYDIEPYLLKGFHSVRRREILATYLELLAKISLRTRNAGLTLGVDIPFWYDTREELTERDFAVEFRGNRKPASEHIIDLSDSVTIMDYRTSAFGADGIAAHAESELAYAAKTGKKVFVGLETTELPDEDLIYFSGKPARGIPAHPAAERIVMLESASGSARIWLIAAQQWEDFLRATREPRDSGVFLWWPATRIVTIPSSKLSFARLGAGRLRETIAEAGEELSRWPSFAGFAIHDYRGLRSLLEASPADE